MLLFLVALAAADPGACGPGRFLAEHGACTGGVAPWRTPPGTIWAVDAGDGYIVVRTLASTDRDDPRELGVAWIDATTGRSTLAPPAFPMGLASPLWIGDPLLVAGPFGQGQPANRLRRLDPRTGAWRDRADAPRSLEGVGTAADDVGVLVVGGVRDGRPVADVTRYDPGTDRWTALSPLATPRLAPVVAIERAGPLVCGGITDLQTRDGRQDAAPVATCERLRGKRWRPEDTGFPGGARAVAHRDGDRHVAIVGGRTLALTDGRWADLGPVPAGADTTRFGRHADGALRAGRFRLDGDQWIDDPPPDRPGFAVAVPGGWVSLRGDEPPAVRGMDLAVGPSPMIAAIPGGGLAVVDGSTGFRVGLDGLPAPLPALPTDRYRGALVAHEDGTLILFGGSTRDGRPNLDQLRLPPGAAAWVRATPAPAPILPSSAERLPSVRVGDRIWAFGDGAGLRLEIEADRWTPIALPFDVIEAATVGDRVLLLGRPAQDRGPFRQPAAFLDPTTDAITPLADVPTPRESPAVVARGQQVLVLGGRSPGYGPAVDAVERLDPATGTWSAEAPLREERSDPTAIALTDGLLVIGGDRTRVERRVDGRAWAAAPLLVAWGHAEASALPDGRVAIAGSTAAGRGDHPDVAYELYDPGYDAFVLPALPTPNGFEGPDADVMLRALDAARAACLAGDPGSCTRAERLRASR